MSAEVRNTCRPALVLPLLALLSACSDAPDSTIAQTAAPVTVAAPAPAVTVGEETPAELMRRANAAFRENRIVDPSGDNAAELFLAVRERDPSHPGLADALVEIMPLAQFAFEAAVRNQDLTEAERLHGLIARIHPESAITRSAATRVAELRTTLAKALADAERVAASAAQATPSIPARRTDAASIAPAAPASAAATLQSQRADATPAATTERTSPPAAPVATHAMPDKVASVAAITAPQPISKVAPDYPPQARSRKVEGFVELEFRVTANGSTEDIRVVRSEPEGLFDRNAVRALMRWKFKPAERNGIPEAATTRTTMNFRQS